MMAAPLVSRVWKSHFLCSLLALTSCLAGSPNGQYYGLHYSKLEYISGRLCFSFKTKNNNLVFMCWSRALLQQLQPYIEQLLMYSRTQGYFRRGYPILKICKISYSFEIYLVLKSGIHI